MKRVLTALVTLATVCSMSFAEPSAQSPEQQVQQINKQFLQAPEERNVMVIEQYVADDALLIDSTGQVYTKAQAKTILSRSRPEGNLATTRNIRILGTKVHGETAIVAGRIWVSDGQQINEKIGFTNVFARTNESWQIIASTYSHIRN